jgi:hypothetical protein
MAIADQYVLVLNAIAAFWVGFSLYRIKWRSNIEIEVKPMTIRQPRYSKEEIARRGKAIYEAQVRSPRRLSKIRALCYVIL